jgi:IclR family mhp operon transcriptional activator
MVFSSHGRAYLSFCAPEVRKTHLDQIAQFGNKEEIMWIESGRLDRTLEKARADGFAVREPNYWADPPNLGAERGSVAVPIYLNQNICGTLGLIWLLEQRNLKSLVKDGFIGRLREAADVIGKAASKSNLKLKAPSRAEYRPR